MGRGAPATKFAILTTQRSGSAWLVSTLNGAAGTTAYAELFLRRKRSKKRNAWNADFTFPYYVEKSSGGLPFRPFSVFAYLNDVYAQPGVVGFKIMYAQLRRYPEVVAHFIQNRVRVVHLVRRNHLDALISNSLRSKTGRSHVVVGEREPGAVRVELDVDALVGRLEQRERKVRQHSQLLRWCGLPHIEVSYEDLCRDPSHFEPIWEFLGGDRTGELSESNLVKIRKGAHREVLSNYGEVKAVLAGTRYAGLIE